MRDVFPSCPAHAVRLGVEACSSDSDSGITLLTVFELCRFGPEETTCPKDDQWDLACDEGWKEEQRWLVVKLDCPASTLLSPSVRDAVDVDRQLVSSFSAEGRESWM